MISADSGETWSEPVRLIDWNGLDGGYPSFVQRADGQIVTAYYCSALPDQSADSMKGYHATDHIAHQRRPHHPPSDGRSSLKFVVSEWAASQVGFSK